MRRDKVKEGRVVQRGEHTVSSFICLNVEEQEKLRELSKCNMLTDRNEDWAELGKGCEF